MPGWEVPKGHRHFPARFPRVFLVSLALRATVGLGLTSVWWTEGGARGKQFRALLQ